MGRQCEAQSDENTALWRYTVIGVEARQDEISGEHLGFKKWSLKWSI